MKKPYTIRLAEREDAEALSAFGRRIFTETFGHLYKSQDLQHFLDDVYIPAKQLREIEDPQGYFLVVENTDRRLLGYAKAGLCELPVPDMPENAYSLHRIYIATEAKGQGIGTALMEKLFHFFREKQASGIFLSVWSGNLAAQKFYARYGFEKICDYIYMVGDHADDDWILQLKGWQT